MIDVDTLTLILVNMPNFAGLLIAIWVLDRRMVSLENLLRQVLDKCLPDD